MKILVLGANGLLGSYVYTYLSQVFSEVVGTTRDTFDVYQLFKTKTLTSRVLEMKSFDMIINCIGITNKRDVSIEEMMIVNSYFPHLLDTLFCGGTGVIHPTTDCVYSGQQGWYDLNNPPDCHDIYGITKLLGETLTNSCVIRVSIIGESLCDKTGLLEWVKSSTGEISGYTNHLWNGITCLEYAKLIHELITTQTMWVGVRHVRSLWNGQQKVSKYDLIKTIIDVFELPNVKVIAFATPICDRTLNAEIVRRTDLVDQLRELKAWSKTYLKPKV